MRLLLLLLLLINIAFFTFTVLFSRDAEPIPQRIAEIEHEPARIEIEEVPVTPGTEGASAVIEAVALTASSDRAGGTPTCLQWAGIAPQDMSQAELLLQSSGARYEVVSGSSPESYWVRVGGLQTRRQVDALVEQLRADGVRDLAVSHDASQDTYTVSLGVFKSEENAKRLHARFQHVGAVVTSGHAPRASYLIRDADAELVEKIRAAAAEFQQTSATTAPCPGPLAAADSALL
jgi:hypothetical protein